ncbi:MAG: nuclear transport factor 2 family protein [Solirubrobacterales bacterium]
MSEENVELVRRAFERWNEGDRIVPDEEIHPDVEIVTSFRPEPFRGREGFRQWIQEIDQQFEEWRNVVDEWRDAGTRVVGLGHLHLRGRGSGVEFDQPMGWLVEFSEGKMIRMQPFLQPKAALEAAGLSE